MEEAKIQWHAAFVSAMDLELAQNRSDLEYHKEYKKQQMRNLLEMVDKLDLKFDRELADSVLQVSIGANKQVVEELRR